MTPSQPGTVRPVPERLHTVTPRLVVADGAAAMAFYAEAFGAQEVGERFTGPDGELIHAETRIGDSVVMITEDAVDGPVRSPERLGGIVTCVMSLYWEDVDAAWGRAVGAGAEVIYPLEDQFYGERGGRLRDPFGQQDRNELGALLVAAGLGPPCEHALISLLALNGLRVSEATGADIEQLGLERGHRTMTITRKGGKVVTIPLAPRTARAIDLAIGERTEGPVFLAAHGRRLDRHGAGRIVRTTARRGGIAKAVTPHTLRHAFITAAVDAGVPLRDVQEAASHADPRTTMRYDRARGSLDRHATYIVAAYVAGAAR